MIKQSNLTHNRISENKSNKEKWEEIYATVSEEPAKQGWRSCQNT